MTSLFYWDTNDHIDELTKLQHYTLLALYIRPLIVHSSLKTDSYGTHNRVLEGLGQLPPLHAYWELLSRGPMTSHKLVQTHVIQLDCFNISHRLFSFSQLIRFLRCIFPSVCCIAST